MAMNMGSGGVREPELMIEMNTTPLIDVMLVLLVMLIVTIPIHTQAIKMDFSTRRSTAAHTPPPVVNIAIGADGATQWNGVVIPDRTSLDSRLQAAAAQAVQPEIHLHINPQVAYQYVVEVLADAQRLGLQKIGIVGRQ